ncbi:MAG: alpha-amylase [Bacteroidia bacterium]|nr:alpha-amylase [Bacteroidia bacterium]NNK73767.1 alpha-amylase [Flavobacteriaceae bacterium]
MKKILLFSLIILQSLMGCKETKNETVTSDNEKGISQSSTIQSFDWESATVYFLLTDRFNNGDPSNDLNFERGEETGYLRGFEGGDLKGVTQKISEGYFNDLGVNAIWMTPVVEQIHGATDEGTGLTYGYHGYWTKDWTAIDPNYGTTEDLKKLVETAHANGIRVLLDAVINHTGPVTGKDPVWPESWVRTQPQCDYKSYESTISCTLVKNLPDIRTDSDEAVDLPPQLVEKWKAEGRYEQEVKELDEFFKRSGHPKAPRFYIMKWLADYISDYGIDGYRVDTVKHTEEFVWQEFKDVCDETFLGWKENNPEKVLDDAGFYLVGEVYGYGISGAKMYDFGDKKVNYFDDAFASLINFDFKWNAKENNYETLFKSYSNALEGELDGYGILNYLSSHDDGQPYDPIREKPLVTANYLLLSPGTAQIYYGDESARKLKVEDAVGDANLRSFMNWDQIDNNDAILIHWQKLGKFRRDHPAVGSGIHQMITAEPYVFYRSLTGNGADDQVVIGLDLDKGEKAISVRTIFKDGTEVLDTYSGKLATVENGIAVFDTENSVLLLEKIKK